eukprot:m.21092 g.21092  ORF g.21092 m.21092 type:complete len:340 (-) comp8680_c0_seq1:183-1202(-)
MIEVVFALLFMLLCVSVEGTDQKQNVQKFQKPKQHDTLSPAIGNLSHAAHSLIAQTRTNLTQWALKVDDVAAQVGCNTIARPSCDCTFWNGILCSSPSRTNDTQFACDAIWRDQSPSNGQLWRSPWEAKAMHSSNKDEFSRDQGLGVLVSTFGRVNSTLFSTWLDYITNHNGYMCPGMYDCLLIPQFWCTFDKVTNFHGLPRPSPDLMTPKLDPSICKNDHEYVLTAVEVNDLGFPLHLAALDVYLRRMMNDWDGVMQTAANVLHRRQPDNVFFQWLAQGASDSLVVKMMEQIDLIVTPHVQNQWTFVRKDSDHAFIESMGWEYILLIDHLLQAPTRPI